MHLAPERRWYSTNCCCFWGGRVGRSREGKCYGNSFLHLETSSLLCSHWAHGFKVKLTPTHMTPSVNAVYLFGLIFCECCSLVAWGLWTLGSPPYPHSLYCDCSAKRNVSKPEICEGYLGSLRAVMLHSYVNTHTDITLQPLVEQKNKYYWANSYICIVGSFSLSFSFLLQKSESEYSYFSSRHDALINCSDVQICHFLEDFIMWIISNVKS